MSDDKKKPEIITYYNETKSGVDVLDKLVCTYSCKLASSRWTVVFFLNMLDIAAYNALVLWINANPNWQQVAYEQAAKFTRPISNGKCKKMKR